MSRRLESALRAQLTDPRRLRQLALLGVFGALIYLIATLALDRVLLAEGLKRITLWQWGVLLILSLINYLLRYWRWRIYIMRNAPDQGYLGLPETRHLLIYFAGFALTVTPGKAGEALRSLYLHRFGVPWTRSLAALIVERLLDILALFLLAIGFLKAFFGSWIYGALLCISVAVFLLMLRSSFLYQKVLPLLAVNRFESNLGSIVHEVRNFVSPGLFGFGMSVGTVAWIAEAIGFFLLLSWSGLSLGLIESVGVYAGSLVAGALSFLPGGLGGSEATMVALLTFKDVSAATALVLTLICRLVTLWFSVILGLVAVLMLEFCKPKCIVF
jgi:uncharacterized protein (TIRG00374 family)